MYRLMPLATLFVLHSLLIAGCGGSGSGDVGLVAFERGGPTAPSVLVANEDGTDERLVIADARDPAIRRDGQVIVFARGRDIFAVNVNGTGLTNLTNNNGLDAVASAPAYSQFADRIAYVLTPTEGADHKDPVPTVRLMDADGGDDELLVVGGGEPAFSPNGSRIVFVSGPDLFRIDRDGTELVQLTFHDPSMEAHSPSFTPFGDQIVYELSPSPRIMILNLGSLKETVLVDSGSRPSVSTSRNRIAFARAGSIFSVNIIGTDLRQITGGTTDSRPSWSEVL